MKRKLTLFYGGKKGEHRLRALQDHIRTKILNRVKASDKIVFWTALPLRQQRLSEICPFVDNQRLAYGNGALDHIVLIHCFDLTKESEGVMAEAVRALRDHGIVDVIGWAKPKYDPALPLWEKLRRRFALFWLDPWSLCWRRYEKVQDLMTLTFTGSTTAKTRPVAA